MVFHFKLSKPVFFFIDTFNTFKLQGLYLDGVAVWLLLQKYFSPYQPAALMRTR